MIGWENNQGAYFIQKLNEDIEKVTDTASDNETHIGKMSDLTTTAKDTLVKAVNEVDSHADTNASAIGTLSELTTSVKTDLVSAVNAINSGLDLAVRTKPTITGSSYDLDDFVTPAVFDIGSGVVHAPQDWAIILVLAGQSGGVIQVAFNAATIRYRMKTGSPLAWTAWRTITTTA